MNLFDILAEPRQCEVILLDAFPPSANPLSFSQVRWPNYEKIFARIEMNMVDGQGGLIFVNVPFTVRGPQRLIVAYAIMLDGVCLFVGQIDPSGNTIANTGNNLLQCRTILFLSRFPT